MLFCLNDVTVNVRKLRIDDMPKFLKWGTHDDIRFLHYNFPNYNDYELKFWYRSKSIFLRRYIYISEDEKGNILGYMTIKNIKWFKRKAELGIVFDPNIVSKGYGTASILKLYDIYFNHLKMKTLFLKVADFNYRAQACYRKSGFVKKEEVVAPFEDQERNFELLLKTDDFFIKDNLLVTKFHYMEITKEEYLKMGI